ncbi:MAG: glutamate-5-semialdehyde dehydrogenase [Candidatus Gracilibacteria bacterium]|jgi:glutamate-5-semialdehyde dehydrogenase
MILTDILKNAKNSTPELFDVKEKTLNLVLQNLKRNLIKNTKIILEKNKIDLAKIDKNDPIYDRVYLDGKRIIEMAYSLDKICSLKCPASEIIEEKKLENGLNLKKIKVPFGVVMVIFEARPNVCVDVFSLCFKSKNVCILKGGSQSENSNNILIKIIKDTLEESKIDKNVIQIIDNDKETVKKLLKMREYIDVVIPRGGKGLIDFVRENSSIPVIETGAGVVHVYFDEEGELDMGKEIVFNAKVSRPSVCNAMDTLIVHKNRLKDLPKLCAKLANKNVQIFADEKAYKSLLNQYDNELLFKASKDDFGKEYLSLKMSIKTVSSYKEAISHINTYGSKHSESIITANKKIASDFLNMVDASCVYVNASTRFTDGGVFELGAEIGISTQKLHARGPMGINELTTYKWEIIGNGQVR